MAEGGENVVISTLPGTAVSVSTYKNEDCVIAEIAIRMFVNQSLTIGQQSPQELAKNAVKNAEILWAELKKSHGNIINE